MYPAALKVNDTVDSKEIMSPKLDPFQDLFNAFFPVEYGNSVLFAMLLVFFFFLVNPQIIAGRKELKIHKEFCV